MPWLERRHMWVWLAAGLAAAGIVGSFVSQSLGAGAPLLRVTTQLAPGARKGGRPLVLTLGGPVYCRQVAPIVRYLGASLACPDYGPDGERSAASRARRVEDWGDPKYLNAVARLPIELEENGVHISQLILVGASYSGYAAAELAATHPELHPRALIIVDSFLDLSERFRALSTDDLTRSEMIHVLGGALAQRPQEYRERSPSDHLAGLATDMRRGMRFVDVWSVGASETREFNGAMCSPASNGIWLRRLAGILRHPVTAYVTRLRHAYALWYRWRQLLALASLAPKSGAFPGKRLTFRQQERLPAASTCAVTSAAPSHWDP
ncbi:MAG: hypothetical protein JO368_06315 [Acidimicrobiales bacterium]|nr:hypothetical protein [Acidimicrobiales bacterium]